MNSLVRSLGIVVLGLTLSTGVWAAEAAVTPEQIAAAKTPAEHEAIAVAFEQEAERLEAKAKEHEAMAEAYSKRGPTKSRSSSMHAHCAKLSKQYSEAAAENRALAKEHRSMGN